MFKIYKCHYIDKKAHIKWEIFGRNTEFTDGLAKRISNLGVYHLRRIRIGFCKPVYTDWPPYELEQAQVEYVEDMEIKLKQRIDLKYKALSPFKK